MMEPGSEEEKKYLEYLMEKFSDKLDKFDKKS
jgi:hypothetical protein